MNLSIKQEKSEINTQFEKENQLKVTYSEGKHISSIE